MSRYRQINQDALRNLVETGGVPFHQNVRSWIFSCPKCGKDRLYVEKKTGRCRCMRCGPDFSGSADYILAVLYDRRRADLTDLLYGFGKLQGIVDPDHSWTQAELVDHWGEFGRTDEIVLSEREVPVPLEPDPDFVDLESPVATAGVAYLEKRGVPLIVAQQYGVCYSPKDQRVIFPVRVNNELLGWQGRWILPGNSRPRLMTHGNVGGKYLMFQDRLSGNDYAVMTEGPFDAIKAHLCGANTATMGKSFTDQQIQIYLQHGIKRLYVGLDEDAAEQVTRLVHDYGWQIEMYRLLPPEGREDLGDCTFEEVLEQFKSAKQIKTWQIQVYLKP